MNPGKLSDGVNTGENWPVPVDEVIEPSSVRNGESRDLTQEEQQFADLLHGRALSQSGGEEMAFNHPLFNKTPAEDRGAERLPFIPIQERPVPAIPFTQPDSALETFPIDRPVFPSGIPIQERPVPAIPFTRSDSALETFPINRPVFPSSIPIQERPVPAIPFTQPDSALETFPIDRPVFPSGIPIQERPVPAIPFTQPDSTLATFPIDRPAFATRGHLQNEPPPVAIQTVDLPYPALPLPRGKASCETPDATPIDANPVLPSGDRILQGLFGQPYPSAPLATPSPVSSSDRMDQLAERLAQRILVSDRTHTSDSEVRIQLRETVLQGAEITFRRDQGQLVVSFNVVDAHVAQQLSPQTDDLQRILATRLDTSVRIEVNVSSGEAGGQGSPGDGRSRNRRDPRDEWGMDY